MMTSKNVDGDQGPGDKASIAGGRTSAKQIRANRENAKKSTGPRTREGKARSAQNARTHRIFVSKLEPVRDGSYAEDPDEFYERVEVLVRSMQPRDPMEWEVATRMVGIIVKLERLDRWSAATIAGVAIMRSDDLQAGARSEVGARVLAETAQDMRMFLSDPDMIEDPGYEVLAAFIRYHGPESGVRIEGFWDDENTPSSPEEWRRAFHALKDALFATDAQARLWASEIHRELSQKLAEVEGLEERIAANRIMAGPFELQIKYEARLLSSLRLLRREYEELQRRTLD